MYINFTIVSGFEHLINEIVGSVSPIIDFGFSITFHEALLKTFIASFPEK